MVFDAKENYRLTMMNEIYKLTVNMDGRHNMFLHEFTDKELYEIKKNVAKMSETIETAEVPW